MYCPPPWPRASMQGARSSRRSRLRARPRSRRPRTRASSLLSQCPRGRFGLLGACRHERTRLRDLRPDRIGPLGECDSRGVMLSPLLRIARLFRRRGSAERGAQPVRLLLQRRFEGAESVFWHTALEQHRAIKLARRYGDAGSDRMLLGLVLGFGGGAHRPKRILVFAFRIEHPGG